MSSQAAASQIREDKNALRLLLKWLEPRSKDRDEAFRERSIRIAVALVIGLDLLSLTLSVIVFRNEWSLISYPTLHVVVLVGLVISAFYITRQRIVTAAWFAVLTGLFAASGALLLIGRTDITNVLVNGLPFFVVVVVLASLVLPRNSLWVVSFATVVMYGVTIYSLQTMNSTLTEISRPILTAVLFIPAVSVILYRLRVEFDSRLQAMRESIHQAEVARQQAEEARQQAEVARQQAEEARQQAEEADKAKSQFLANMSHELRTPLNAIIGYDEAMLGGMVGEFTSNQSKLLGHIQHNSRRLLGLINDILDLSKIESGSVPVFLSPMSPHKVIQETLDGLRSLADEKKIELTAQFTDAVPEVVLGDTNKLQQILVNLVSNAIKFTDTGSVTVNVSVVDSTRWLMEVRDTGIGMPSNALNTIFEPFQQIDSTDKRKYKGTGLGLAITKRLVESLAGKIEVKSTLGEGSTFSVTLPRAHVPEATIKPLEAAKEIAS